MVSPSYDGLSPAQRRRILADNPYLFANAILSADVTGDRYNPDELAEKNRRAVKRLLAAGAFAPPSGRSLFVYRLEGYGHRQTGLVGLLPLCLYRIGRLRAHENTRAERQELLQRHLSRVGVQSSPIGIFHRALPEIEEILSETTETQPILAFSDIHDVRQKIWRVCDAALVGRLNDALAGENLYLTDGHHRLGAALAHSDSEGKASESADLERKVSERKQRRAGTSMSDGASGGEPEGASGGLGRARGESSVSPDSSFEPSGSGFSGGYPSSDFILAALFSEKEIRAMGFHRIVRLPDGCSHERLAEHLRALGSLSPASGGAIQPPESGRFGVFLGGRWYRFTPHKASYQASYQASCQASEGLDVTWLQEVVLQGILGMDAKEIGERVEFLPGRPPMPHQTGEAAEEPLKVLERRCEKQGGVGFALHPVPLSVLKRLCDDGDLMPPKSTFFHPKPRSGVFMRFLRHPPGEDDLDAKSSGDSEGI